MPATIPTTSPSHGLAVIPEVMKAVSAPTAIVPSIPRFNTPERSLMIAPRQPSNSGVEAGTARLRMLSRAPLMP